jgi:hypothetical protein
MAFFDKGTLEHAGMIDPLGLAFHMKTPRQEDVSLRIPFR